MWVGIRVSTWPGFPGNPHKEGVIDDKDFFDALFQHYAKTTGAEDRYWRPLEDGRIVAVGRDESQVWVAAGLSEADADFITAVHGCLPDLVRRLHSAVDEADRLDAERDELCHQIARLELEIRQLKEG